MLKIPEPLESTQVKLRLSAKTKKELETYVNYLKTTQSHATTDIVVETLINNAIPRTGKNAKGYNEFKRSLEEKSKPTTSSSGR